MNDKLLKLKDDLSETDLNDNLMVELIKSLRIFNKHYPQLTKISSILNEAAKSKALRNQNKSEHEKLATSYGSSAFRVFENEVFYEEIESAVAPFNKAVNTQVNYVNNSEAELLKTAKTAKALIDSLNPHISKERFEFVIDYINDFKTLVDLTQTRFGRRLSKIRKLKTELSEYVNNSEIILGAFCISPLSTKSDGMLSKIKKNYLDTIHAYNKCEEIKKGKFGLSEKYKDINSVLDVIPVVNERFNNMFNEEAETKAV